MLNLINNLSYLFGRKVHVNNRMRNLVDAAIKANGEWVNAGFFGINNVNGFHAYKTALYQYAKTLGYELEFYTRREQGGWGLRIRVVV